MNEEQKEELIRRGHLAEEIQTNPVYLETLDFLRERYRSEWAASKPEQTEHREYLFALQRALADVETHIRNVAISGKLNKGQEKQIRPHRKPFEGFFS